MWNNIVSTIETEIIKQFEEKGVKNLMTKKPEQPKEVDLINKLILEYMDWMGYKLTSTMFVKGMCE